MPSRPKGPKHFKSPQPEKLPYQHAEAFCLMEYQCEACSRVEVLWNSRDGVTPFGIACKFCGSSMLHQNWHYDKRVPDYVPKPGQRVFIDMPESLRRPLAGWKIATSKGTPYEVPEERREEIIKAILESFHEGEPWIIEWPV